MSRDESLSLHRIITDVGWLGGGFHLLNQDLSPVSNVGQAGGKLESMLGVATTDKEDAVQRRAGGKTDGGGAAGCSSAVK